MHSGSTISKDGGSCCTGPVYSQGGVAVKTDNNLPIYRDAIDHGDLQAPVRPRTLVAYRDQPQTTTFVEDAWSHA
jgi:hypothetical protein